MKENADPGKGRFPPLVEYTLQGYLNEIYHLRILLGHIKGLHLEEHLRTVDRFTFSTCREAAKKLGLLLSDNHHQLTRGEADTWANGAQLRELFSIILVHHTPTSPRAMWKLFAESLSQDFTHNINSSSDKVMEPKSIENYALPRLNLLITDVGKTSTKVGLSEPDEVAIMQVKKALHIGSTDPNCLIDSNWKYTRLKGLFLIINSPYSSAMQPREYCELALHPLIRHWACLMARRNREDVFTRHNHSLSPSSWQEVCCSLIRRGFSVTTT